MEQGIVVTENHLDFFVQSNGKPYRRQKGFERNQEAVRRLRLVGGMAESGIREKKTGGFVQ